MARVRLLQLGALAAVLALWALIAAAGLVSSTALPGPRAVAVAFWQLAGSGAFWQAVGETLRGAVTGLVVAVAVGIPVGLVTGVYAAAEESSRLLMEILRSFPVIALLPVFLLVLGSTPGMKATVVFIACVFPVLLQAQYGAQSVPPSIRETVHGYRIPRLLRFRRVILPGAAPSIMTGLRLAATTSVLVAIGVEVLTTLPGIGHMIMESQQAGASARAYACILTAGAIGHTITLLAQFAEHRLLRWRPPALAGGE
ncbi:ABC transporter permease [Streptomyces sp. NBC_00620]|uniref:ABC transporter permease n=1 Tax=unclassified Streptomyces TaxID=2593676 RepID=UPI002251CE7B|nr:ABC transporter permease [Streptomyces sp. NBC_00620]MCX4977092.1 ABC transporter permease [Streptomyces sp. NBC_00620]WUC08849.1 ABC transporter permease [Streptomyces sp. NBC_00564]WUC54723.1 ABC transporter permease [Streptomyces sp. NBC_00554]